MPALSGSTKKVSVYGRKAEVRVVNRHSTFTSLENDENDPFGFFKAQPKPKITYGRSRASTFPADILEDSPAKDAASSDDSLDEAASMDKSAQYDTANSSVSFHSAHSCSFALPPLKANKALKPKPTVLTATTLNFTSPQKASKKKSTNRSNKAAAARAEPGETVISTPKARTAPAKRAARESPATLRALTQPPAKSSNALPTASTPPSNLSNGRAPRRAAQAARVAIEDYDFTDRDMTPRRPVPTKSYFAEKARQLAELASEEQQEKQRVKDASSVKAKSRKSMATRPRQTTVSRAALPSSIANSSSSDASSTQTSFSLVIPSIDEMPEQELSTTLLTKAKAKRKQNKHVTRRIADLSDDEAEACAAGSDDDDEADVAASLVAQISGLTVTDQQGAPEQDAYLGALLAAVSQTAPEPFAKTIQQLRSTPSTKGRRRLEKIGEASYSEVFKIFPAARSATTDSGAHEALVIKIIPVANPASVGGASDDELPYTSAAADVEREVRLMQLIGREAASAGAFVSLQAAHVVKGGYPAPLLQAWDRWDAKRRAKTGEGAENIRPDALGGSHAYAVLVMTDGGVDLESLRVKSWVQAASIFWQVSAGLAEMEARYKFEHRDLHWGNILVQSVSTSDAPATTSASEWLLDPHGSGVKATIIDFTLSRATTATSKARKSKAEVLFYPFDDETLFEGSGDTQFDVYREMRLATLGQWHTHCPATNMLWLRYLAHKLVDAKCKSCKTPAQPDGGDAAAMREWRAHKALVSATEQLDRAAQDVLASHEAPRATGRRKSLHPRATMAAPRKGRATTRVTPLTKETNETTPTVRSATQLMHALALN